MATFDNIRLEKGLYATGKSFSEALEGIDPSENYKGTALEGLDAYQRQLKRFDIKVSGKNSDCIEKFFRTTDSAALFPEYVSRAVWQGFEETDMVSKFVATTTMVEGIDYRSLAADISDGLRITTPVNEGSFIPETKISVKENLVKLKKHGRMITASYEAIKYQRLDLFTIALKQIGSSIARAQFDQAIEALLSDDGSGTESEKLPITDPTAFGYDNLVSLWMAFNKFKLTTLLVHPELMGAILNLEEFRDSAAGLNFHGTGKLITPFGAEVVVLPTDTESCIIGLDKSSALERVQAGTLVTEFDKLIDRQLERASVTMTTGFAKIYNDATKIMQAE